MSIIIENEYEGEINIPYEKIAHEVIEAAINYVDCPYECEVNLMLTDNEMIHAINKEQRERTGQQTYCLFQWQNTKNQRISKD